MYNPIAHLKQIRARFGMPLRPIVEFEKDGTIVNVITTSVQDNDFVNDAYHEQRWALTSESKPIALYLNGVYTGMGYVASDEGVVCSITKDIQIDAEKEITKPDGTTERITVPAYRLTFKGIISKLIDGEIIRRGSSLSVSMTQTLVYCALALMIGLMAGMSWK